MSASEEMAHSFNTHSGSFELTSIYFSL